MLVVATAAVLVVALAPVHADPAAPLTALANLPVTEVTIFKDGHALMLHQGKMNTDADGNVLMDYLPSPVLGTFWPFSADKNAKLTAVVSGQHKVLVERTALTLRDLIESNVGAVVGVTEVASGRELPLTYQATILGVPARSGAEQETTNPPNGGERLPIKGTIVLLKTGEGTKVLPLDRIQDITIKSDGKPKSTATEEEFRNLLTLKLDWAGAKAPQAEVGLMYLQRGLRWIPSYKVTLDGKGNAAVKLEATLINEMVDLNDVTANLVIGVPTIEFKDDLDPIGLQQTLAQLSQHFAQGGATRYGFSNAIMSQQVRMMDARAESAAAPGPGGAADLGPEITGAAKSEDLYVFTVRHVTLKKGQRLVMPVTEFALPYKDVYVLDIPATPPPEVRGSNMGGEQEAQMARMLAAPKVMHKVRLTNKSGQPLTTAPALIFRDNTVLGQGLMTYAATGSDEDLPVTTAVDIKVKKTETQTQRTPNAATFNGHQYFKMDLAGKIALTNYRTTAVDLEVVRHVLGNVDTADHDGAVEMVNVLEDFGAGEHPTWWNQYQWPYWWNHFNGMGRVTWKFSLDPGKSIDLGYTWDYFWE
jgi:hypothetical protein